MHDSDWTGEFHLTGEPVHKLGRKQRPSCRSAHIGFVFQSYHLLDDLTVAENLEMPLSYRNLKKSRARGDRGATRSTASRSWARRTSTRASSRADSSSSWPSRARSIASPKLILADEPTGNLHSEQGAEIMELFQKLNGEGTTIIQVTHSETNAALRPPHRQDARRLDRELRREAPRRPSQARSGCDGQLAEATR